MPEKLTVKTFRLELFACTLELGDATIDWLDVLERLEVFSDVEWIMPQWP